MITFVITGFILGLTSNLHCIGMCGPIALAVPLNRTNNWTMLSGAIQYNLGRIFTYSILGIIVGMLGLSLWTVGILQWLSILAGIGLILFAWRKYFTPILQFHLPRISIQSLLNKGLGRVLKSKSPFRLFLLGNLNGALPCGMVFAALLNATLTGNSVHSGLAMVAFGVGTLPAMIALPFLANKLTSSRRQQMNRVVPYLLTLVGLLIILRGMNLNIPFISPQVNATHTEMTSSAEPSLEMSCCHAQEECIE